MNIHCRGKNHLDIILPGFPRNHTADLICKLFIPCCADQIAGWHPYMVPTDIYAVISVCHWTTRGSPRPSGGPLFRQPPHPACPIRELAHTENLAISSTDHASISGTETASSMSGTFLLPVRGTSSRCPVIPDHLHFGQDPGSFLESRVNGRGCCIYFSVLRHTTVSCSSILPIFSADFREPPAKNRYVPFSIT